MRLAWSKQRRRPYASRSSARVDRMCRVNGVDGDWRPLPGAGEVGATPLGRVAPGRVVGVGAACDLARHPSGATKQQSFAVSEFVDLEDGRRVTLHEDRGFTLGPVSGDSVSDPARQRESLESLTRDVLNVVLPDDDVPAEDHPWSWLADLARTRGLDVTAQDLRGLPYQVIFTEEVHRWLAGA